MFARRRLIAAFQPHLYTRTRDFAGDFGRALSNADAIFLTEIYPAREAPLPGVTSGLVAAAAAAAGRPVAWRGERADLAAALAGVVREGRRRAHLGGRRHHSDRPGVASTFGVRGPRRRGVGWGRRGTSIERGPAGVNVSRVPWSTVRSVAALSLAAGITVAAPWWGPRFLAGMAFFRVRAVEVDGARYTLPADVVDRLHVDTTASVWDDHRVLESRVRGLPQVRTVAIGRKLPGTLVVRVTERLPVALGPARATNGGGAASGSEGARVPDAGLGLRAYDADGAMLPIDPTRVDVDLPIVTGRDVATFRLLGQVRE